MTTDKIDNHYFQQLSALVDGDLAPDQARFLLRRMEHDTELSGCLERWQLCGDALRGHARPPAPAGFAGRIAAAIAADPLQPSARAGSSRSRGTLAKWGGGALAASLAAIALFMVRQQVPDETPVQAAPTVASQTPVGKDETGSIESGVPGVATVTAASVAVASLPRRQNDARRSATRNQQAARKAATVRAVPERAVATAAMPSANRAISGPVIAAAPTGGAARDPFSNVQINTAATRPWPRAVLSQYAGSGAFTAGYSTDRAAQTFYPFEPRLPAATPEPAQQD
ncbi:MAG: RseA family anti-sigma factor [Pseudoxanthomonas sp.]